MEQTSFVLVYLNQLFVTLIFFFIFQNIENIKNYQKESKQIKLGNPLGFGEFGEVSKGKNDQLKQP